MSHLRARLLLLTGFLVACGARRDPRAADAPLECVHAFFAALDRHDVAAVDGLVADAYYGFSYGRFETREELLRWAGSKADAWRSVDRTVLEEKVAVTGGTATYTGHTVTRSSGDGGAVRARDEWQTLVLSATGGTWRVAHWQFQDGGIEGERHRWNQRFAAGGNFRTEPNRLLVEVVEGRPPGVALDVGMGQGRNALYLASLGWKVTGVDLSDEGVRQAQAEARRRGLSIEAIVADVGAWDWGENRYDLVALVYAGGQEWVEKVRRALKPGGLVVIEFFVGDDDEPGPGLKPFRPGEVARLFGEGFTVVRSEEVTDVADFSLREERLVRFVAVRN